MWSKYAFINLHNQQQYAKAPGTNLHWSCCEFGFLQYAQGKPCSSFRTSLNIDNSANVSLLAKSQRQHTPCLMWSRAPALDSDPQLQHSLCHQPETWPLEWHRSRGHNKVWHMMEVPRTCWGGRWRIRVSASKYTNNCFLEVKWVHFNMYSKTKWRKKFISFTNLFLFCFTPLTTLNSKSMVKKPNIYEMLKIHPTK